MEYANVHTEAARLIEELAAALAAWTALNLLVEEIWPRLVREFGIEANEIVTTVIDYWLKSEVVHSGYSAVEAYHIPRGDAVSDLKRLRSVLRQLLDLRVIAATATHALVRAYDAEQRFERPRELDRLKTATERAREFLQARSSG